MSILRVVLSRKLAAHTHLAWTKCCSSRRCPDETVFHDGNFDHSVSSRVFPWDGECTMLIHFPKTLRAKWSEKSTYVCPIVRNGSRSLQCCGAWWRRQDTVHECFVKSTEVVSATRSPRSAIKITCNQVNFLWDRGGTKSEDELLGDAFLLGVDVADMWRQHCKALLAADW